MKAASHSPPQDDAPESEPFLLTFDEPRNDSSTVTRSPDLDKPLPAIQFSSFSNSTTPPAVSPIERPTQPRRHSSLSRPKSPNAPKTPRTANRVRFNLSPKVADDSEQFTAELSDIATNGNAVQGPSMARLNGHASANHKNHRGLAVQTKGAAAPRHSPNPVRTWVDDEDYMDEEVPNTAQRERLLEGVEAGSVSAALEMDEMDAVHANSGTAGGETGHMDRARAKSGLRSAFMNMANSIIGAGIIGESTARIDFVDSNVFRTTICFQTGWITCWYSLAGWIDRRCMEECVFWEVLH